MSEIIAKLGLNSEKFDRGLDNASRGWESWAQKMKHTPVRIAPEFDARESAKVFEEIEAARQKHLGETSRAALEQGLGSGSGAVGDKSGRTAADSARAFEESFRAQEQHAADLTRAHEELAAAKRRTAYDEANTVGRIKHTQGELVTLAKQRNAQEQGTVARLRTEQQIEERLVQLRRLQRTQQAGNLVGLPSLQETEQRATGILGLLRRKFSSTDLFKDSLKGLGVGLGVGAIVNRVVSFFSHGAERAKAMADHSEALVDIQRQLAGAMGGPRRELELQVKHVNELNRDIEAQKKLIESLRNAPLEILSEDYQAQVDEAENKLNSLVEKQAQLSAGAKAAAHAENLRTAELQRQQVHATNLANIELRHGVEGMKFAERQRALEEEYQQLKRQGALPSTLQANQNQQKALAQERELFFRNEKEKREDLVRTARLDAELTKAEMRDASDVEKKQIRLNALRRDYDVIKRRTGINSNETEANRNQQRALQNEIKLDQEKAQQQLISTLAGVGNDLAGRGPNGGPRVRPRGRSERERLADRGAQFQLNAEEGVRTGRSPEYIARMARAARVDLESVGGKVGASTAKVSKQDANALGSPLLSTNKILTEIRDNLKPNPVK